VTRKKFATIVERVLRGLPPEVHRALDEVEIVIQDRPDEEILRRLGMDPGTDTLYGYYDGLGSSDPGLAGDAPPQLRSDTILIFREPLVLDFPDPRSLAEQIRITVLHEIGHHLGLDEDDMERLGYD
jgi:predicted Zn-dependent protease with MMP-like domain